MQKVLSKVSVLLAVFMMVLSLTMGNVFAANVTQDGLVVNTVADKEIYKKGDKASITISITNTNDYDMKDIAISTTLPKDLEAPTTDFKIPLLKANESKEYQVVIENKNSEITVTPVEPNQPSKPTDTTKPTQPSNQVNTTTPTEQATTSTVVKTSDNMMIGGWIGIIVISSLAILFLIKRNKKIKLLAIALISIIGMGSLNMQNIHAENTTTVPKTLSTVQDVVYGNTKYSVTVNVAYSIVKTNDDKQMVIHQGETVRITSNLKTDDERFVTFNSPSGAIIDYAYYCPQEKDLVNGHGETNISIKGKYDFWMSGKTYTDVTVIKGEVTLDTNALDKGIVVKSHDTPALTKYVLNKGDTWTFKQKDGVDFKELGLSAYVDSSNGSAHVDQMINDLENNNVNTLSYDHSYEEASKYELEYHANARETELKVKCIDGTIVVYVRNDNLGELEIIK